MMEAESNLQGILPQMTNFMKLSTKSATAFLFGLFMLFVMLAVCGDAKAAAKEKEPEKVLVGAHINDVQEIDLQSHSYRLDLYVWFRWSDPTYEPYKSAEFMNAFEQEDHVRTPLYDEPQKMPDGSLYMIIRDQGKFSTKFPLQRYPFDRQNLIVTVEDSIYPAGELVYLPDPETAISFNPGLYVPGFNIGKPALDISVFTYPTNFGDLREKGSSPYSRASFVVPVERPQLATGIKVFLPVALILFCTALVFFVHPAYIEGRLGVAITALLTLVALQLTTASTLPEVDYLLMTDKIYLLSYLFIIGTLTQVVRASRLVHAQKYDDVRLSDRFALGLACLLLFGGIGAIVWLTV